MEIIGLSGYAGSGKDTAALALIEHGFERVSFADVLREIALAINPRVKCDEGTQINYPPLSLVISRFGWDKAKNRYPEVRELLQRLGTEAGRQILGENIWVDTAFNNATSDKIVVTDVRFPNEAEAIKKRGGVNVRIHRPGVHARNQHASEISLDDYPFDYHIDNAGSIEDLHREIVAKFIKKV